MIVKKSRNFVVDSSSFLTFAILLADLYSGMMRGLYPGQGGGGAARNYAGVHPGISSYHQHNLHRYQQVGT